MILSKTQCLSWLKNTLTSLQLIGNHFFIGFCVVKLPTITVVKLFAIKFSHGKKPPLTTQKTISNSVLLKALVQAVTTPTVWLYVQKNCNNSPLELSS